MDGAFTFHKLNAVGIQKAKEIAQDFDHLLGELRRVIPDGRELSIVRFKLEEACFFAKKGMANQIDNQEPA